jgi:hypothetical protein
MLMKYLYTIFFLFFFSKIVAQNNNMALGGRAVGMGNATVAIRDEWAVSNNIAGIATLEQHSAGISYYIPFGQVAFQTASVAANYVINANSGVGISLTRFGDKTYSEQRISLGYAHKISNVSIGGKINYVQVAVNDGLGITQGKRSTFAFEIGGLMDISEKLSFGLHAYNINQGKLRSDNGTDRLPVILKAGASWKPIKKLFVNIEVEKDVDYKANVKFGIDYEVFKTVWVRTGLNVFPQTNSFGIGFCPKNLKFDYALVLATKLGLTHQFSLIYQFKKKEKQG